MKKFESDLSVSGLKNLANDLRAYAKSLTTKCDTFIRLLAQEGISVGQLNCGAYTRYITFSMKVKNASSGKSEVLVVATNTSRITSKWQTSKGIRTEEISPILMAEFGSGWFATNMYGSSANGLGGQGTLNQFGHAFDKNGWWWTDLDGVTHHSYGEEPTLPMYHAYISMVYKIQSLAKSVFGK